MQGQTDLAKIGKVVRSSGLKFGNFYGITGFFFPQDRELQMTKCM